MAQHRHGGQAGAVERRRAGITPALLLPRSTATAAGAPVPGVPTASRGSAGREVTGFAGVVTTLPSSVFPVHGTVRRLRALLCRCRPPPSSCNGRETAVRAGEEAGAGLPPPGNIGRSTSPAPTLAAEVAHGHHQKQMRRSERSPAA
jgi:hypothetical protein